MKTLLASVLMSLSLTAASATTTKEPRPAAQTTTVRISTTFKVGVFPVTTSDEPMMNVIVDKVADSHVFINVYGAQGESLSSSSLPKKAGKYWTKLNLSHLPDGAYTITVSNGVETTGYEFVVNTAAPRAAVRRISME
jgi:hypothetical protein